MNSNDQIFKTDLASLKYSKPMAFKQELKYFMTRNLQANCKNKI